MTAVVYVPYVSAACPICNATVERTKESPLNREVHRHLLHAHREELRTRLDNPKDAVIASLWDDWEISFRRGDL